jgi:hypothetical protein
MCTARATASRVGECRRELLALASGAEVGVGIRVGRRPTLRIAGSSNVLSCGGTGTCTDCCTAWGWVFSSIASTKSAISLA